MGHTNNYKGRPVGAKNRTTYDSKLFISDFLKKVQPDLIEAWKELTAFEKHQIALKYYSFITPRMRAVDATINFARLDPQTIDEIVAGLAKQQGTEQPQLGTGEAEDTDESETD